MFASWSDADRILYIHPNWAVSGGVANLYLVRYR